MRLAANYAFGAFSLLHQTHLIAIIDTLRLYSTQVYSLRTCS